jgi:hypothetical protein
MQVCAWIDRVRMNGRAQGRRVAGGESAREQIADFEVQVVAENLRHCVRRGCFWNSRGALHQRQKQQGPTTTDTCYVVSLSQARGRMNPELYFFACGIARHDVYSWDKINPQKTTHQIGRICGARLDCAVASARSFSVCVGHTFKRLQRLQKFSSVIDLQPVN